ncbi:N-succinylarginine dihydrolase [Sphingopyxis microcysteis]|uniref:N-succinylarginine dihydrolase n=1 Tax=Sphingopyxis microcysteis TaxID=2484145 RepID=UPI0014460BCF|nr:N-succinylarginine dihydrolase [Sphingopyxis microcysteis]
MREYFEINFDGLIGPSHNYGGLSFGNLASHQNSGLVSFPRQAALQGLNKMRRLMDLGLHQGFLPPQRRPDTCFLRRLGFKGTDEEICVAAWAEDPALLVNAMSASAMWTANAATVSPAPDTSDGRCHLTVANLGTMPHRSMEWRETLDTLRHIFVDQRYFAVHDPVPACFGDEGAANHMRMAPQHGDPGIEILVFGERKAHGFPARQDRRASQAIARLHGLDSQRTLLARQSALAIEAGAFHNDVVAVANEHVLIAHEQAFEDKESVYAFIREHVPGCVIIEVPADQVSLEDAVRSYLFNSQLVTLPAGAMALLVPTETQECEPVRQWLDRFVSDAGPVERLEVIDVRESMRNGGGPACLRLRLQTDAAAMAAIDPRYLLDEGKWEGLHRLIEDRWPERIEAADLGRVETWQAMWSADASIRKHLQLPC